MPQPEFAELLEHVGKDPSRLIFEDELTGIHNRRFLLSYLEHKVRWESGQDYPLSLLIIDVDSFKQINDTYGHDTGDQALGWLAALLREVVGDQAIPIRYGGDEFVVVLPHAGRDEARRMADRLLQRTRDRAFRIRDSGVTVPIRLSIGLATAPDDGSSNSGLFQAADTALFHAKQSGRDQAASAADIDPEKVFSKTALYRLKATGIVGRDEELAIVSEALDGLSRNKSQFVILEAAPGMGKSTLLEEVRRNLAADDTFCVARLAGDPQEAYRPYYLASRMLVALLNQREDKGEELFQDLSGDEFGHLAEVLPQLSHAEAGGDGSAKRHGIFATLADFIPRAVDYRPLVLLIDDLQFADEATLLLLRVLIQTNKITTFVCGSSLEFLRLSGEEEASPLERFYSTNHKELGIRRVKLRPLNEDDIGEYLKDVFPSLRTPPDFEAELSYITNGNPLFLGEIVRKLVTDRKVALVGKEWVIETLDEGYLPRSLEEIVKQKIADLDEESRQLLERASMLGEDISVSILAGSSDLDENRVLEFLDRAEALGLISLDFQVNDEIMRFLGKRVLEISYGAIDSDRRKDLHAQIGEYQERLHEKKLLPSASLLAYHFKRSTNQEKARRYEQVQLAFNQTVFSPEEAAAYAGEFIEEELETERRLDPGSVRRVPEVLRTLASAVRNIQLYPSESKRIAQSLRDILDALAGILEKNEQLHLAQAQHVLLVNGQRLDTSRFRALADSFLQLLTRAELQAIVFHQGVTAEEIRALVNALGKLRPEVIDQGFWRDFTVEYGLAQIELRQVRYSRLRRKKRQGAARTQSIEDEELEASELREVPKILRSLLGATQNAKLYPLDSKPVEHSLDQLRSALGGVLNRKPTLTLASAGQFLLVNGAKTDTTGYAPLANNVLDLMKYVGLGSITFGAGVTLVELRTLVGGLGKPSSDGIDKGYWDEFAAESGLTNIGLNQRQYALGVVQSLLVPTETPADELAVEADEDTVPGLPQQMLEEPPTSLRDAVPTFGKELLIKGESELFRQLLRRLFENFPQQDAREREKAVGACHSLFVGLILGLQHKYAELAADSLLNALASETEPRVLHALSNLLHEMAGCAVHFADYPLASLVLLKIKARREQLLANGQSEESNLARLLDRRLDPTVQNLLVDDMKSGQTHRQERAAQVIGGLGRSSIPMLIEVIKQERDFRVRQLAASLLAETGPEAGSALKRAVMTEVTVEQRFRILEVIDTVTRDLEDELTYSFGDSSAKIRRAAFRLFERLHDEKLIEVILPLARDPDPGVAKGAIRSLAHLRSPAAVSALVTTLNETDDPKVATACCQALGELRHASSIDCLARVLALKKAPLFRWRWSEQVRATAAMALKQIAHPRATAVLSAYVDDTDVRVRQLASSSQSG